MRTVIRLALGLGILTFLAAPFLRAAKADDNSILIVFKDGRQQSFRLADIARIEFVTSAGPTVAGGAKFLGRWRLGDGIGSTFLVTLDPDGTAHRDRGPMNGTWTAVGGEARIRWDDGWLDVIRKIGGRYKKVAYSPGTDVDSKPDNISSAEYLETQ